jgi:integrase
MGSESWVGGRVRTDRRGRRVYVIERMVDGKRIFVTLGPVSEDAALAELALFERAPAAYKATRASKDLTPSDAVTITAERVQGCLERLAADGCSDDYRADCKRYLVAWTTALDGADLRTVKLLELTQAMKGMEGARAQRIAALKTFTRYLRDRGELENDATLLLHAPQPKPEKTVRKKGYDASVVERIYRGLQRQEVRDVLRIRAMTGQHHTEIDRVARGRGVLTRVEGQGEIAGTVALPHKSGDIHIQALATATLEAYERLQRRGSAPDDRWVARQCQEACDALKLGVHFNPGELRHTFATLARSSGREVKPASGGLPLSIVASAMGHRSERTTSRFYDMSEIPPMVVVPLQLHHPDDPVQLERAAPAKNRRPAKA